MATNFSTEDAIPPAVLNPPPEQPPRELSSIDVPLISAVPTGWWWVTDDAADDAAHCCS